MKEPIIGIDLGTRYALCAHCPPQGTPNVLPNRWGEFRTPSFVALSHDGILIAGSDAARMSLTDPTRSWWDIKRKVGTNWTVTCDDRTFNASDLIVPLLLLLREDAEAALGCFVNSCVLAVPAHFGFPERGALSQAAKTAGFSDIRIVNEPTAAALSVGTEVASDVGGSFLVLDYGAGTTDVSVVEEEGGVFQVVDSMGRSDLGGYDLDRALAGWLWRHLEGFDMSPFDSRWPLLMQEAEQIKISLSDAMSTVWLPPNGLQTAIAPVDIKRQDLEIMIAPMVIDITRMVERLYKRHSPKKLLLVGGSSRLPLLRQRLSFKVAEPDRLKTCADEAVALGAALYARQGKERLLLDVLSQSIGAVANDGALALLLRRGTPLPAEGRRIFTCPASGYWEIKVVHGEGALHDDARVLQKIEFEKAKKDDKIEVRFKVDDSGLLSVDISRDGQTSRRVVTLAEDGDSDNSIDIDDELKLRQDRMVNISLSLSTPQQQKLMSVTNKLRLLRGEDADIIKDGLEALDRALQDLERTIEQWA